MKSEFKANANLMTYTAGFLLSLALTITAFIIIQNSLFQGWTMVFVILGLAITQLIVQATFFLHLNEEAGPRFNLLTFCFMIIVVFILVVGSLWIMKNMDYNMMPKQQEEYLLDQYNKGGF